MNNEKKSVDVKLSDGSIVKMEYSSSGREQVGTKFNFQIGSKSYRFTNFIYTLQK